MLRFTETQKWADPWFQQLSPEGKLFYLFLLDQVDYSGVWEENWQFAEFLIGQELGREEVLVELGDRVAQLGGEFGGKLIIPKFIFFQLRGAELNPDYNPHKAYLKCLSKHGLRYDPDERVTKPCPSLAQGFQDKKKKKEKKKSKVRGEEIVAFPSLSEQAKEMTITAIIEVFNELCPSLSKVLKSSPKRRRSINARQKDGMASLKDWENVFKKVEASDFLTGRRSGTDWRATFDWLIKPDNMTKVIEGNYDNQNKKGQDHGKGF